MSGETVWLTGRNRETISRALFSEYRRAMRGIANLTKKYGPTADTFGLQAKAADLASAYEAVTGEPIPRIETSTARG